MTAQLADGPISAPAAAADAAATPADSASASPPAGRSRTRDPWFDNVRLVAAVLIVVMHVLTAAMDRGGLLDQIWNGSWAFRIPVLVVISGFFSSAAPLDRRHSIVLLRNILFVYLAFEVISTARTGLVDGDWDSNVLRPEFGMWFLLSLFFWRLALPVVANLRWLPWWVVAVALGSGFVESANHSLSMGRTLALFPFFVLGWYLSRLDLRRLLDPVRVRLLALVVLVGLLAVGVVRLSSFTRETLYLRGPYTGDVADQLRQAGVRGAVILFAVVAVVAMLAVIPRRRIPVLSYLGTGSLYVYLLHLLLVQQAASMGLFDRSFSPAGLIALVAGAVLVAFALASPPVRWATRWLIQPRWTWPFVPAARGRL